MNAELIGAFLGLLLLASFWKRGPEVMPHPLFEDNERLRAMNIALAERVLAQSELLAKRACRNSSEVA